MMGIMLTMFALSLATSIISGLIVVYVIGKTLYEACENFDIEVDMVFIGCCVLAICIMSASVAHRSYEALESATAEKE